MAKINFKSTAISATTLSPLMDGRERLTMDSVISKHPDGVTIKNFDIIDSDDKPYAVVTCFEEPDSFFFGGAVLTKIVQQWIRAYDGDIDAASHDLEESGGVKVQFSHGKTKKGNNITMVKVVE